MPVLIIMMLFNCHVGGKMAKYAFLSVSSIKTRINIGVCVLKWEKKWGKNTPITGVVLKADELGLFKIAPDNDYMLFELDQKEFEHQNLELNRFYSREEMSKMEFEKF